ncbi:MAG: cell division protein FtsA [Bryobacterales bacterium]|nr:cell division protein FtsA [Bryobacterales bacterium]
MGDRKYAIGLDAGSDRSRCLVGALENSHVRLLGAAETPSGGWRRGRIADQEALAACLSDVVREAEKSAGVPAGSAVAGMGGSTIEGLNMRGVYWMGPARQIREEDARYAVEKSLHVDMHADRMILQMAPQDFLVDGQTYYWNPKGVHGSRLEALVHLITVSSQEHHCLVTALHRAGLEVEETVFESYASAYASVSSEERAQGVVVVDVGKDSSEVVIYCDEALMAAVSLPVCGEHFTRDVAQRLCISNEHAESLKRQCGCALVGLTADNSLIELPPLEGRPPREAPRLELNHALESRAGELFLYVREEIAKAGMDQGLLNQVVLTGGASRLQGMCDMAERVLNCPARNGLPVGIEAWPEEFEDPAWTTAAGLMMYSARLKRGEGGPTRKPGLWNRLFG